MPSPPPPSSPEWRQLQAEKPMMIRLKTEMGQNFDHQPASSPKRGIFERFMNKSCDQAIGEHSQEMGSAQSSESRYVDPETGSGITVKVEDGLPKQTGANQDVNMQDTKIALSESLVGAEPQGTIDGSVPHSLAKQHEPASHNKQGNIAITSKISKQEEQMEEISDQIASTNDTVLAEEAGEKTRRKNSSEKKRKRKHSRKRSKSRDRSKRSKIAEPISSNDGRTGTKSLEGDEEDGFDVAGTRAKIPKDLSIRHEATQKEELKEGSKLFNSKKFKKMMVANLKDHQVTVASWMVKREKEMPRLACGGIIGDEMGLGKTVTSLACIAANKLRKEDRKNFSQATLVVVPNRKIATQWLSEAKKHWHEDVSSLVTIYDSANGGNLQLAKQWIVLATYCQVRNSYPKQEVIDNLRNQYDDRETYEREFEKKAGDLFRIHWFRVILDEAHSITRFNGRTSRACCDIRAQHRWGLTGTPISNKSTGVPNNTVRSDEIKHYEANVKLPEFYSYAEFIMCTFIGNRRIFRNEYIVEEATNDDFDTVASYLIYRRTADEQLKIPPTTSQDIYVPISQEEEILCDTINEYFLRCAKECEKTRERAAVPNYEPDNDEDEMGEVEYTPSDPEEEESDKKPEKPRFRSVEASKQLRLRQALSHPYCLENFLMGSDYLNDDEIQSLVSKLQAIQEKKTTIEQLEADENWKENIGQYEIGLDALKVRDEAFFGGVFDMSKIMDMVFLQHTVIRSKCGGNDCSSQTLSRFKCGHIYCSTCISQLMMQASNLPDTVRTGALMCTSNGCNQELLCGQPVTTLEMIAAKALKDKKYVEMGRDAFNTTVQARFETPLFFIASSYGPRFIPPPSSRVTATMAVAMTWLSQAPQDKIIIFTQFIPTLRILGCLFETLGVRFIYYSGTMPKQKQEHAMNAFQNDPTVMVMVSTLKSGGQSHNLTVANRVILVDPWWNKTVEKQAISRVVRMGQKKETYAVRIMTNHSIDSRVVELQTIKEEIIARMLQDDGHERVHVEDKRLTELFNPKPSQESKKKKKAKSSPF